MNYTPNYNLGLPLGSEKYDVSVFNANASVIDAQMKTTADGLVAHATNQNNPHNVTKEQVGLGNVDNTSDADKPVSSATSAAIATAVATEQSRAIYAEVHLNDAIVAEQTRATTAEGALSSQISAISGDMPGIATVGNPGLVAPDGTTITIDANGVISGSASVPIATVQTPGIVAPDGVSITIDANGTIRSNATPSPSGLNFFYGTCSTAGATAAKLVTANGFSSGDLITGTLLAVKFDNQNTATPITLNVNSTGDITVVRYGTTSANITTYSNWAAGQMVLFVFDGTYWSRINAYDGNSSTYAGLHRSAQLSATGTASSTAVSYQRLYVDGTSYEVTGTKYMEITNTSASSYTFSNSAITTSSIIDIYTDTWGDNPSAVTTSSGSCTVTFGTSKTRTVRIYIK